MGRQSLRRNKIRLSGLPRRFAPRNDGGELVSFPLTSLMAVSMILLRAPALIPSLRGGLQPDAAIQKALFFDSRARAPHCAAR